MIELFQTFNPADFIQVGLGDFIDKGWDWLTNTTGLADAYNNTGAAINQFMIDLCNRDLINYGKKMSNNLIGTARALGAIFAICVAAGRAYKVMAEGDRFNILSVMRPLIFAFILSFWPAVCNTLLMPGQYVENYMRGQYIEVAKEMDRLREQRNDKAYQVSDHIYSKKVQSEEVQNNQDMNIFFEGASCEAPSIYKSLCLFFFQVANYIANGTEIANLFIIDNYVEFVLAKKNKICKLKRVNTKIADKLSIHGNVVRI